MLVGVFFCIVNWWCITFLWNYICWFGHFWLRYDASQEPVTLVSCASSIVTWTIQVCPLSYFSAISKMARCLTHDLWGYPRHSNAARQSTDKSQQMAELLYHLANNTSRSVLTVLCHTCPRNVLFALYFDNMAWALSVASQWSMAKSDSAECTHVGFGWSPGNQATAPDTGVTAVMFSVLLVLLEILLKCEPAHQDISTWTKVSSRPVHYHYYQERWNTT